MKIGEKELGLKAILWQGIELLVMFLVSYIFTGSVMESGEISLVFMIFHAVLYWLYDNLWFKWVFREDKD